MTLTTNCFVASTLAQVSLMLMCRVQARGSEGYPHAKVAPRSSYGHTNSATRRYREHTCRPAVGSPAARHNQGRGVMCHTAAVAIGSHVALTCAGQRGHECNWARDVGGDHQEVGRFQLRRIQHFVLPWISAHICNTGPSAVHRSFQWDELHRCTHHGTHGLRDVRYGLFVARLPFRVRRFGFEPRRSSCTMYT